MYIIRGIKRFYAAHSACSPFAVKIYHVEIEKSNFENKSIQTTYCSMIIYDNLVYEKNFYQLFTVKLESFSWNMEKEKIPMFSLYTLIFPYDPRFFKKIGRKPSSDQKKLRLRSSCGKRGMLGCIPPDAGSARALRGDMRDGCDMERICAGICSF